MRWVWESLPGWSTSKAWWACLSVDTLSPRATIRGMTLARSVVLPEPLQPARPMMRMRHYSRPTPCRAQCASLIAPYEGLLRRLHPPFRRWWRDVALDDFLFEPHAVMLLRPIDVDGAVPHPFERAFHPDRTDIDVSDHDGDEQQRRHAVDDLGHLHVGDVGPVEREHENVTGCRDGGAAEHDDPIDHLLSGIEPIGGRMVVADDAATALQPPDVDPVRDIPCDPHQENREYPEREREAQIIVRVFCPLRPGVEGVRAHQREQQGFTEGDVET